MHKLTRTVRSALLVGALVIAPAAAKAATIVEPITINFASSTNVGAQFFSQPIPKFDPTLGTLNDVMMSVTGPGSWSTTVPNDVLTVVLDGQGFFSNFQTFTLASPGISALSFNLLGITNAPGALANWTEQGGVNFNEVALGIFQSGPPFDFLSGDLSGTFTFDYTPNAAVPEPSTWAMMLLGFVGLGFAFRQSRRKVAMA